MSKRRRGRKSKGKSDQIVIGVVLIVVGTVLMLSRAGYLANFDPGRWWPLLLVAWGIARFVKGRWAPGVALMGLGLTIQLDYLDYAQFQNTWPLILIGVGAAMALESRAAGPRRTRARDVSRSRGELHEGVMSGGVMSVNSAAHEWQSTASGDDEGDGRNNS